VSESVGDAVRPVILVSIFATLGFALGAAVFPNSDWAPGLVLIGACAGGLVDVVWVLARLPDEN